jgi:hypothetical protein
VRRGEESDRNGKNGWELHDVMERRVLLHKVLHSRRRIAIESEELRLICLCSLVRSP